MAIDGDGSSQWSTYRKPTGSGQDINFQGWVPLSLNRNLIYSLISRARRTISDDTINDNLVKFGKI